MHLLSHRRQFAGLLAGLVFAGTAQSALLEVEPGVWRDTLTNLEWLHVSHTTTEALGLTDPGDELSTTTAAQIMTGVAASDYVVNQGFRVALSAEVFGLYDGSGGAIDFADNNVGGLEAFPDLYLLGVTNQYVFQGPDFSNEASYDQVGMHLADDGISLRQSNFYVYGLDSLGDFGTFGSEYYLDTVPDPAAEYSSYDPPFYPSDESAVYLVRTVVPIPSAVYLLGSGLLLLMRLRRRSPAGSEF